MFVAGCLLQSGSCVQGEICGVCFHAFCCRVYYVVDTQFGKDWSGRQQWVNGASEKSEEL